MSGKNLEALIWSRNGVQVGQEIHFLCPCHNDHNPSARWNPEKQAWYCDVCQNGGGWKDLVTKLGLMSGDQDTPENSCTIARDVQIGSQNKEINDATLVSDSCTLAAYAKAKQLPVDFLMGLGLTDTRYQQKTAIKIPYFDSDNKEIAIRYRTSLKGHNRFRWRKESKPQLYGLWKVHEAKQKGYVVLVEGESDCHTLWFHNFPAIGLPGASTWSEEWANLFNEIESIYVVVEPDQGGASLSKWLSTSKIRDRAKLIQLGSFKDPSEVHLADSKVFPEVFKKLLDHAVSWSEQAKKDAEIERAKLFEHCKDLATSATILENFASDLLKLGFVGENKTAKLIYLALTSRIFDRPVSLAVKGPSSSGKSYLVETTLKFFPQNAVRVLSAMSEKSLIYSKECLSHRFLILFEATGLSSETSNYLMRSLLSEGRIHYETVEKTDKGLVGRAIDKEGPTGFITTTTAINLHPENETRLLSLNVSDTSEQTKAILKSLADEGEQKNRVNFEKWHALQNWIAFGNCKVKIPYAAKLAEMVPPVVLRLRRDFHHILVLIRSHALINQKNREKGPNGEIIATLEDYEVIRELVSDVISEGVGTTVSETIRETVEAVQSLINPNNSEDRVTITKLAQHLKLDSSAVRRRASAAIAKGYLQNQSPPRKALQLVLGEQLPDALQILPTSKQLSEAVQAGNQTQNASADDEKELNL